jgi:Flp pilus assembly CpaE family ATPase
MTMIAVCSAKGAPGATTTALALALTWPLNGGSVLLVDADPAGADLASGYLQGATGPGAGAGAVATARSDLLDAVHGSAVALDANGSRLLLAGPARFPPTRPGATPAWSRLRELDSTGEESWTVLVDVGRLPAGADASLLAAADLVVLVTGSSLRAVAAARPAATVLRTAEPAHSSSPRGWLLVVGERRPYPADEVASSLGLPLLGSLAWDPRAAVVLSDGASAGRWFARTPLMRSVAAVTGRLRDSAESLLSPLSPLKPDATPLRSSASAADQGTVVGS